MISFQKPSETAPLPNASFFSVTPEGMNHKSWQQPSHSQRHPIPIRHVPHSLPPISQKPAAVKSARSNMTDRMGSPPAIEDQARLLEDALVMVRQQTHLMRKCLETPGKLMDALKCR